MSTITGQSQRGSPARASDELESAAVSAQFKGRARPTGASSSNQTAGNMPAAVQSAPQGDAPLDALAPHGGTSGFNQARGAWGRGTGGGGTTTSRGWRFDGAEHTPGAAAERPSVSLHTDAGGGGVRPKGTAEGGEGVESASNASPNRVTGTGQDQFKSVLCYFWLGRGDCPFGDACSMAHGT